ETTLFQSATPSLVESADDISGITDEQRALASEMLDVGAEITSTGLARVYHRTSAENAESIRRTGKMRGREDGLFFSTRPDGQIAGYGDSVVEFLVPLSELQLDDIFADEAHVRVPTSRAGV